MACLYVYAFSDVHTDFPENMERMKAMTIPAGMGSGRSVCICCGDIADQLQTIEATLAVLKEKFDRVFFCAGNHELWLSKEDRANGIMDSFDKLARITKICDRLKVHTTPQLVGNSTWIVPMQSWYSPDFDDEYDASNPRDVEFQKHFDFQCDFNGIDSGQLPILFAGKNVFKPPPPTTGATVITFSHFVPRSDCLPAKEKLHFKQLYRYAGSPVIEQQLRSFRSSVHIFGHTHTQCDKTIDGIRYLSNPLGYPRELYLGDHFKPLLVFEKDLCAGADDVNDDDDDDFEFLAKLS